MYIVNWEEISMKKHIILFVLIFVLTLTSCSVGEIIPTGSNNEYLNESVIGSASENTEVISELSDIIGALTVDSVRLPEFSDTASALSKCGDSLLNHLLTTNYSRFSGNTAVKEAAEKYPNLGINAAIGASEYEGALYKYFNHGGNIRHSDTARFRYMPKIEAYIPAVQSVANSFSLDIVSIDETPNTYRMTFYCKRGEEVSPEYNAIFVKRDKGGCYIAALRTVASEKVNYRLPATFS